MSIPGRLTTSIQTTFEAASAVPPQKVPRRKSPPPFSLRLTQKERSKLEQAAEGMPLGAFIRSKLFEGDPLARRKRGHAPRKDHAALAQVLGMLGNMRLASNLNQLARSANGRVP